MSRPSADCANNHHLLHQNRHHHHNHHPPQLHLDLSSLARHGGPGHLSSIHPALRVQQYLSGLHLAEHAVEPPPPPPLPKDRRYLRRSLSTSAVRRGPKPRQFLFPLNTTDLEGGGDKIAILEEPAYESQPDLDMAHVAHDTPRRPSSRHRNDARLNHTYSIFPLPPSGFPKPPPAAPLPPIPRPRDSGTFREPLRPGPNQQFTGHPAESTADVQNVHGPDSPRSPSSPKRVSSTRTVPVYSYKPPHGHVGHAPLTPPADMAEDHHFMHPAFPSGAHPMVPAPLQPMSPVSRSTSSSSSRSRPSGLSPVAEAVPPLPEAIPSAALVHSSHAPSNSLASLSPSTEAWPLSPPTAEQQDTVSASNEHDPLSSSHPSGTGEWASSRGSSISSGKRQSMTTSASDSSRKSITAKAPGKFKKLLMGTPPPLIAATKANDPKTIESLLAPQFKSVVVSEADRDGMTALHHAAQLGHVEIARLLLAHNAVTEARTKAQSRTPLYIAAEANQPEITALLIDAGAALDAASKMDGATATHKAAHKGHVAVLQRLLAAGADPNRRDAEGMPPVMWAVQSAQLDTAAVLVRAGADLAARIRRGANLENSTTEGVTVLHKAVAAGSVSLVRLFLHAGADANAPAPHGMRCLACAASRGDAEVVALLLEHGADIEARTYDGMSALHCAALGGHRRVAQLLIRQGASVDARTLRGETPRNMALRQGFEDVV